MPKQLHIGYRTLSLKYWSMEIMVLMQNDFDYTYKLVISLVHICKLKINIYIYIYIQYLSLPLWRQLLKYVHAQVLFLDYIMKLLCGTCFCNGNHIYKWIVMVFCYWYQNARKEVLLSIVFALCGSTFGILLHVQWNYKTRCLSGTC